MTALDVLESKDVYTGRVFSVSVDQIREGDQTYAREVVRHPGSAAIVAVYDDDTVALVRQYRHPAVRYLLEVPAGSREVGELPEDCAARELEEELGVVAGETVLLTEFFASPGFCGEKMWVFLATNLRETKQRLEADEMIEVVRLGWTRLFEMIAANEIEDAKTMIGLTLAAQRLGVATLFSAGGVPEEF